MDNIKEFILNLLSEKRRTKTELQTIGMEQGNCPAVINKCLLEMLLNEEIGKDLNTMMFFMKR